VKVGAVVVSWRDAEVTVHALRSIAEATPGFDTVVCVAQELTGEQLTVLRSAAPNVVLDVVDSNLGYSGAANRGVDQVVAAGCDWVMLVNNDATIDPRALEVCLAAASREPRVAVIGPAVAFADEPEKLWYGGGIFNPIWGFTRHRGLGSPAKRPPATSRTGYVPGCCALLSAAAWKAIGPYRDDYFMYCEDVEWCQRARAAGWSCLYLGEVLCWHAVSVSAAQRGSLSLAPTSAYYLSRNSMRFAIETPNPVLRVARVAGTAAMWAANARRLKGAPPKTAHAYATGLRDAVACRMGPRAAA
jgi:GT2 family glycosyltransferase